MAIPSSPTSPPWTTARRSVSPRRRVRTVESVGSSGRKARPASSWLLEIETLEQLLTCPMPADAWWSPSDFRRYLHALGDDGPSPLPTVALIARALNKSQVFGVARSTNDEGLPRGPRADRPRRDASGARADAAAAVRSVGSARGNAAAAARPQGELAARRVRGADRPRTGDGEGGTETQKKTRPQALPRPPLGRARGPRAAARGADAPGRRAAADARGVRVAGAVARDRVRAHARAVSRRRDAAAAVWLAAVGRRRIGTAAPRLRRDRPLGRHAVRGLAAAAADAPGERSRRDARSQ